MAGNRYLTRWSLAAIAAGVFTGGTVGLTAQPEVDAAATCNCSISGSGGEYSCSSPSACGAGSYDCSVSCGTVKQE